MKLELKFARTRARVSPRRSATSGQAPLEWIARARARTLSIQIQLSLDVIARALDGLSFARLVCRRSHSLYACHWRVLAHQQCARAVSTTSARAHARTATRQNLIVQLGARRGAYRTCAYARQLERCSRFRRLAARFWGLETQIQFAFICLHAHSAHIAKFIISLRK